jgi:raffinose/stachyose/melibiose transport system substrate-binding protein
VPTTFEEFEQDLATAKTANETPIQFGNLEKWPGIHEYGAVQNQIAPKDQIRDFVFGRASASFDSSVNTMAASKLQEWANNGYFTSGFNGLSYDDAWPQFAKGKGVFLITGTWLAPDLVKTMGDDLGMFLLPPATGSSGPVATGGEGLPLAVTAGTKNPDLAAAYLDFMTSAHAMDVVTAAGLLPVAPVPNAPTTGVLADVFNGWATLNQGDGLVPYLDYSTPTFYDTITADIQELLGGKADPTKFVTTAENDYKKFYSAS